MKDIIILGASGSIGSQTLKLLENKKELRLAGFSVGKRINCIKEILEKFKDIKFICVQKKSDYNNLKKEFKNIKFFYGNKGLIKLIKINKEAIILNALVGFSGVKPSLISIKKNHILLLANKESLVVAGQLINKLLKKHQKAKLIPIDSEHVAIKKCLLTLNDSSKLKDITITASGGPFFNLDKEEFKNIKLKDALNHPTWSMGNKITIDSSTLMNKTFEIIEAYYLFNIDISKINVLVDRKSLVHGFITLKDNTYILNYSEPTMLKPIEYALDLEKIPEKGFNDIIKDDNLEKYNLLKLDFNKFSLLKYASLVINKEGTLGCILNATNEVCVDSFLNEEISYLDIIKIIDKIMNKPYYFKYVNFLILNIMDKVIKMKTRREIKKIRG